MDALCWSRSVRSWSEKNSLPANLAERCSGVSYGSVQIPCRSGSPHGVLSDAPEVWLSTDMPVMRSSAATANTMATMPIKVMTRFLNGDLPSSGCLLERCRHHSYDAFKNRGETPP